MKTIIPIDTYKSTMVYGVSEQNKLLFLYFGKKLGSHADFSQQSFIAKPDTDRRFESIAVPTLGGDGFMGEPMLSVKHADGALSTELRYLSHNTDNKDKNLCITTIRLKDSLYPLWVDLKITAYLEQGIITQQLDISHNESSDIELLSFYSGYLSIKAQQYHLTHFHGSWAGEMKLTEELLTQGSKIIESKKGLRTTQTDNTSFLLALGQASQEDSGEVIGGSLAWSGNYRLSFEVDEYLNLNVLAGINPFASNYSLSSAEVFQTPTLVLSYSDQGKGQLSRNFHCWVRRYNLRHGDRERLIVLNSWEGAYFDFDQQTITAMIDHAAQLGVEVFVLDDGWFGNSHPRNSDNAGLGDWQVNMTKLPAGINYLADYANNKGLQFGIWIEPEMVNPDSDLAAAQPDWIVHSPGREKLLWRNQLVLDMTNPEVQEFVFTIVDTLKKSVPNIDYLKWDANRHIENIGSSHLAADKQSHFWIDYTKGLYNVYERVRAKYPDLTIQLCASGGGRLDLGSLAYHDEFWPSDNTDPMSRLSLQYASNIFYPAIATGAHISTSPNHQTGLSSSLKFRTDVAMTGRLGMELQPKDLQGEQRTFVKNALAAYKNIRAIIQFGHLYRIHTPIDGSGWVSLAYVTANQQDAVLFLFSTQTHARGVYPTVKLKGLDARLHYQMREINNGEKVHSAEGKTLSGEFLMQVGVDFDIVQIGESVVLKLTKTNGPPRALGTAENANVS